MSYFYITHPRCFVDSGEQVYKIGTIYDFRECISEYTNGSVLVFNTWISDIDYFKRTVIPQFSAKFNKKIYENNEYYEGNVNEMIKFVIDEMRDNTFYNVEDSIRVLEGKEYTYDEISAEAIKIIEKLNKIDGAYGIRTLDYVNLLSSKYPSDFPDLNCLKYYIDRFIQVNNGLPKWWGSKKLGDICDASIRNLCISAYREKNKNAINFIYDLIKITPKYLNEITNQSI